MLSQFDSAENPTPTPEAKLPIIAIIGRPNTGKSTIVNKLTKSFKDGAIVHNEPGITRDRTYRVGSWNDYNFQVVDTGGIVFDDTDDIFADRITQQALIALSEANAAVFVCDGQQGLVPLDQIIVDFLRKHSQIPLYLAVNKCESETQGIMQAQDFWELGVGLPYPVSGIHGTGLGDLLDEITTLHMDKVTNVLRENATNVALVGRPNVGKSSLFNRLVNEERSIVSDQAGTTRDTVDALLTRGNSSYRFIDTAGIRKRGKVMYGPEFFMVGRAFKAIRRAEVVVLMLDAITGLVDQDRILAQRIADEGRSCVIALNKWDAVPEKDDRTYLKAIENIRDHLPSLRWADVVLISALTGQRSEKLFDSVDRSAEQFGRRIPTAVLNEIVNDATLWMAPPTIGSRSGRIYYCIQISTAPPTIVFFCNDPDLFTDNYQRFLERKIRDALSFEGTPIKMIWRGKSIRDVSRAAKRGTIGAITSGVLDTTLGTTGLQSSLKPTKAKQN
ncbi:GTP-binding protein EngA [Ochromonadaceae sp. CCMP2298]|nr:GTP-binding protein EngA [Ochromonadaceae sp. CCMP2298]